LAGVLDATGSNTVAERLIQLQEIDGGWLSDNPEGEAQDVAYAVKALVKKGGTDNFNAAVKGAGWLKDHQGSTNGWENDASTENTELTSEAVWAISDYVYVPNTYYTIQDAIDAASEGDTINVATGVYMESLIIDQRVNLIGENKETTIINGDPSENGITITSDNVEVSGFTVTGAEVGLMILSSSENLIENNIFDSNGVGIYLEKESDTMPSSNNIIRENTISNSYNKDGGIYFDSDCNGNSIIGNYLSYNMGGIYIWKASGNIITENLIENVYGNFDTSDFKTDGNSGCGIQVMGGSNNDITYNEITGDGSIEHTSVGLQLRMSGSYATENNNFHHNTLSGNDYEIEVSSLFNEGTDAFSAENNYWGNAVYSVIVSDINGNVDFEPYYIDPEMTILSDSAPTTVYVDKTYTAGNTNGHYFGYDAFSTIQAAINAANTGGIINVAAGTYNESQILIDKPLTLQGAGYATTIIDGGNIALTNPGLVRITADGTVTLSGFTIQNTETGSKGIGVYVDNSTAIVKILDNTINELGKAGIVVHTAYSAQIEGNIISTTDHSLAPNGIQIGYLVDGGSPDLGITGSIKDNDISGFSWEDYVLENGYDGEGLESGSINWTGAGILITDIAAGLEISNNNIYNNNVGIDIEAGASTKMGENNIIHNNDYGVVLYNANPAINNNKIENNSTDGVFRTTAVSQSGTVNATNNWWGTADETGIQELIYGDVAYDPWYTNEEKTILSNKTVVPDDSGNATVTDENPEVIITDPAQATTVTINSGTTNPKIDVSAFITGGTGTLPKIDIASANANNVTVAIPASTQVTSEDTTWDGIIAAPTITTITLPTTSGQTKTLSTAIEVGFTGAKLSFDKAVRLLLPGQAGKRAGYVRTGTSFTEINDICSADSQDAGDALSADGDCKINVGSDLVIWTKHFTKFAAYTQTANTGGGGGGGTPFWVLQQQQQQSSTPEVISETPVIQTPVTPATPAVPGKPAPKVLGEKTYADGTLVRGRDKKIFVIIDGQKKYIANLKELAKYAGQKIYDVENTVLIQYPEVLGAKVLADGMLMRGADGKIYTIKNGKKQYVRSLEELRKGYFGKKIYDVSDETLAKY
jgi:parallel beta-helix repeat protein